MSKIKIKDLTFGELQEYVKINCPYSNGKMRIDILGYNCSSLECVCGLPTNDSRNIILQGDSDKVLEQELEFDTTTKDRQIKQLQEEVEYLKMITPVTRKEWEQKAVKEFADELKKYTR